MLIKQISFASAQYEAMKRFREEYLRLPLGLLLSDEDVKGENHQIHIAAIRDDGSIVGTVLLKPLSSSLVKLRQMAVHPLSRQKGVGRKLVQFAEEAACTMGFNSVSLHARTYAKGFYEKLGYQAIGEVFIEVTLPTIKMVKHFPR